MRRNLDLGKSPARLFADSCAGGIGTIDVDGKQVAQARIDKTVAVRFSFDETFDVVEDTGTPVSEDYDVPFKFTAKSRKSLSI